MGEESIGLGLDQRRSTTRAGAFHGLVGDVIDREQIIAVHAHARHAITFGARRERGCGALP